MSSFCARVYEHHLTRVARSFLLLFWMKNILKH